MSHKHRYVLELAGKYVYYFKCSVCERLCVQRKHEFRLKVRGEL